MPDPHVVLLFPFKKAFNKKDRMLTNRLKTLFKALNQNRTGPCNLMLRSCLKGSLLKSLLLYSQQPITFFPYVSLSKKDRHPLNKDGNP